MYQVLKSFKYADNGIDIVSLKEGDTFNYETTVIDGLIQDGFLKAIEKETKIIEAIESKPLKIKKDKGE